MGRSRRHWPRYLRFTKDGCLELLLFNFQGEAWAEAVAEVVVPMVEVLEVLVPEVVVAALVANAEVLEAGAVMEVLEADGMEAVANSTAVEADGADKEAVAAEEAAEWASDNRFQIQTNEFEFLGFHAIFIQSSSHCSRSQFP